MCVPGEATTQADEFTGRLSDVPKELQPKPAEKKKNVRALLSGDPNDKAQMNFQPSAKMERCIQSVKVIMRKRRPKIKDKDLKSAAIAICRARLKK